MNRRLFLKNSIAAAIAPVLPKCVIIAAAPEVAFVTRPLQDGDFTNYIPLEGDVLTQFQRELSMITTQFQRELSMITGVPLKYLFGQETKCNLQ